MIDLLLCGILLLAPMIVIVSVIVRAAPCPYRNPADLHDAGPAKRAQELLYGLLPEDQRRSLGTTGYLAVSSRCYPGREYRIWYSGGPVEVHEAGRYAMSLCVEPLQPLPPADVVLMHKLLIEGQEEEYLRVANKLACGPWLRRMRGFGLWGAAD